ncbi:MAG TPA: 3D-(3,5/4)-trihydroxycyclohexane-1,2-dione acylhydrolase (decyclizing) [Fastidiosipila sp.]|nr:3D-(3,5/4)-trihydroxycyclohexane-1,2-dione acylhydrolase (decyclizing) [Fastidiosipila sp.]
MKTRRLTTAQALVHFLDNQYIEVDGVETKFVNSIFGIFGHGCVVGVGEALEFESHNLTFYQGKNEQSMGLAAMAYAKQKKRREIIPCVSSIGPGATNMVTAAACATANRIPLLVLPGDTFATRQPDPVLQQVEMFDSVGRTVNDAFKAVCRYFDRIDRPEQLMTAAINAIRVLVDPADTGAVCIALPQDVEGMAYDYPEHFLQKRVWHMDRRPLAESQVKRAVEKLSAAKKPLLIVGGGVRYSEAGDELLRLAKAHNIPFAETQAGKGTLPQAHELNLGGIGVTGTAAANQIAKDADLVIGVGTRFSDFTTASKWLFQNEGVEFMSINVAAFDAYKLDAEAIIGDAKLALGQIADAMGSYKTAYDREIATKKQAFAEELERLRQPVKEGFSQTEAVGIINDFAGKDGVVVCAAGSLPGDLQRMWQPGEGTDTYHVEYGYSNMGYDLNGALGVKMAEPDRDVFAMVGDGGYLMLPSEMHTMVQERLKVHVCLFDNSGWGCIEDLQNNHGGNSYGTVFLSRDPKTGALAGDEIKIDYAMNARSLGFEAYTVRNGNELKKALNDAKATDKPVLFDIKVLPGSMTDGYGSWWHVGVAEVSQSEAVLKARAGIDKELKRSRKY